MKLKCPNCGSSAQIKVIQKIEEQISNDHKVTHYVCLCGCSKEMFVIKHYLMIIREENEKC